MVQRLAEDHRRDTTALLNNIRFISERHLYRRYTGDSRRATIKRLLFVKLETMGLFLGFFTLFFLTKKNTFSVKCRAPEMR